MVPEADTDFVSAWWTVLKKLEPDAARFVRCNLVDGGAVAGWLHSLNVQVDETGDREMVLSAPLYFTSTEGEVRSVDFGAATVSARNILTVEVTYHDTPTMDDDHVEDPSPSGLWHRTVRLWRWARS